MVCTLLTNNVIPVQFIVSLEQLVTRVKEDVTTDVKSNGLGISVKVYTFNCTFEFFKILIINTI